MSEETLFANALSKTNPAERAAYLDEACAGDQALRERVEGLLKSHASAGSFLEVPAARPSPGPDAETQTAAGSSNASEISLEFLQPSAHPGHLGRLGEFEILKVVGRGGMGVVFKALDESLRRVVAIKAMAPELAANVMARRRFQREAHAAAAVSHDHVVTIHGVQEADGLPCIIMQYVEGESLQDRLDRAGPLDLKETLRIGMQTAAGLAAAHAQGLIHRDIKPANILLENGIARVKITDFGLARAVDDDSVTQSGVIAGTPQYMAPEQAAGDAVDLRADLFSLGSVMYAMCTGHPPFRASGTMGVLKRVIDDAPRPIEEINPEVPDWLRDIIAKLHAKKPQDRFQTANEVAELLERHLAHLQQPTQAPMPPRVQLPPPPRRHRGVRRLIAPLVLVLLAILAVAWSVPTLRLYVGGNCELTLDDSQSEFGVFVIHPGTSTTEPMRVATRSTLRLPPGEYRIEAIGQKNAVVQRWNVGRSALFYVSDGHQVEGHVCQLTLKRGERVNVSTSYWANVAQKESEFTENVTDKDRLDGTWVFVSAEIFGKPLTHAENPFLPREFKVSGARWGTVLPNGKQREGGLQVHHDKNPKQIEFTGSIFAANQASGVAIFRIDGDRLMICAGGSDPPTAFKTDPDSPNVILMFQRASAESRLVKLKFFTPGKDKLPVSLRGKAVTVEGDAWRIENDTNGGNFNVIIAQVLDGIPKDGLVVFRAKVRVEAKHELAWGSLNFGGANHIFVGWDQWPAAFSRYDGKDAEWTEKEVRHPVAECRKTDPPAIYMYAGLHANGVLWLKDVELLHLPASVRPDNRPPK